MIAPRSSLPHLGRDKVHRILRAEGLSRRPAYVTPDKAAGKFKEDALGFVHLDVKHLPINGSAVDPVPMGTGRVLPARSGR